MLVSSATTTAVVLLQLAAGVTARPTNAPHNIHITSNPRHHKNPSPLAARSAGPALSVDLLEAIFVPGGIDDKQYKKLSAYLPGVLKNGIEISTKSWELGTITETLLELEHPELTPFAWNNTLGSATKAATAPRQLLNITAESLSAYDWSGAPQENADSNLDNYLSASTSKAALRPGDLVDGDGSLGDPCSLGVATWVLAHYADIDGDVGTPLQSPDAYAWAVGNQYAWLKQGPIKNGVISHRESEWQLWADQGYMIPPFIAYLGLATKNEDMIREGWAQWTGVSEALLDTQQNLYRHITDLDENLWLTGNAWMLLGLMRVIASIKASGFNVDTAQAEATAAKTFKALFESADSSGLMPNYINHPSANDAGFTSPDAAGTAGVVAAYYRFLKISPTLATTGTLKTQAVKSFGAVVDKIGTDYWLKDVVDPSGKGGFVVKAWDNTRSPEGQSFTALMWAARTAAGQ